MAPDVARDETRRRVPIAAAGSLFFGLYAVVAWLTSAPVLILVLNALALAATIGVLVLYVATGASALLRRRPNKPDWLIVGTLSFVLAFLGSRGVSVLARDFGMVWIIDTDFVSFRIALSLFGAICLLVALYADEAPFVQRWRVVSAWLALGAILAGALLVLHHGHPPPLMTQGRG